jgi:hypothetical protein
MTKVEQRILLNQVAIIAGLKEHMRMQHGSEPSAHAIERFDQSIAKTAELMTEGPHP